jgi:hypothetical protein
VRLAQLPAQPARRTVHVIDRGAGPIAGPAEDVTQRGVPGVSTTSAPDGRPLSAS